MAQYHAISDNDIASMMHKAGVRPSVQRIAIMSFVGNSRLHPSAEEIYRHLHEAMPSLSRTTVYNSLHTLAQLSLIRELEIEPGMTRYDLAVQAPHAHFRFWGKLLLAYHAGPQTFVITEASVARIFCL